MNERRTGKCLRQVPNSNFSGQRKEKFVAKIHGKKVKTNISRSFARVIFVHIRPFITILLCFWFLLWILRVSLKSYKADVAAEKNVKRLLQDSWHSNFAWLVYENGLMTCKFCKIIVLLSQCHYYRPFSLHSLKFQLLEHFHMFTYAHSTLIQMYIPVRRVRLVTAKSETKSRRYSGKKCQKIVAGFMTFQFCLARI
jgi:hypothetical protein